MKTQLQQEVLHENAGRCIWMDAGQVSYKLCDSGFECDHCPFDAIMQRGGMRASRTTERGRENQAQRRTKTSAES